MFQEEIVFSHDRILYAFCKKATCQQYVEHTYNCTNKWATISHWHATRDESAVENLLMKIISNFVQCTSRLLAARKLYVSYIWKFIKYFIHIFYICSWIYISNLKRTHLCKTPELTTHVHTSTHAHTCIYTKCTYIYTKLYLVCVE